MSSNAVPPPPPTDNFTSELCLFLSSLSTTTGAQFDSLTSQLVRLREALLEEAVKERADSDSENETFEDEEDVTVEETLSDRSIEKTMYSMEEETEVEKKSLHVQPSPSSSSNNNHKVMLSLQKGSSYELNERLVKQALSQFGKVVRLKLFQMPIKGAWGFIGWCSLITRTIMVCTIFVFLEFRTANSAAEALNQVLRAGDCWLHTSLPVECLTQVEMNFIL